MADNPLNLEKMLRGSQNLDVWETATNGDENTDWTNLVGDKGPSLKKAIKLIMQKAPIESTPFATKAALLADTTFADGTFAFVYDDSAEINGIYVKKSGAWRKTSYDSIRQFYALLPLIKSQVGIKIGVNILDLSRQYKNRYFNYQTGELSVADDSYIAIGVYEIQPSTEYQVSSNYTDQTAFFDSNMQFVGGLPEVYSKGYKFTTPADAKYIGLSARTHNINELMLAKSSEFPSVYTPYVEYLPSVTLEAKQIKNLGDSVKNEIGYQIVNIADTSDSKVKNDYYVSYGDGNEYALNGFSIAGAYPVKPSTEYRISDWQTDQIAFYDDKMKFVGGIAQVDPTTHKFVTPPNAKFIKVSTKTTQVKTLMLAESALYPSTYTPYQVEIKGLTIASAKTTEIFVSADANDATAQFKGKNAVQLALDSIVDASEKNRYVIKAKRGLYKITQANEFIGYRGYPCMICPKDWVDIVGEGIGETILWAELPYDDAQIGASIDGNTYPRDRYQAIYNYSGNSTISDLTIVCKNLRYTNHQDDGRGADKSRNYKNVEMIFKGNKGYNKAWGCGDHSGESTTVVGGRSHSDSGDVFAVHNNIKFSNPSSWSFNNHTFTSLGSKNAIELQNDGSLLKDKFNIVGCSFGGMSYIINYVDVWLSGNTAQNNDTFDHAEWRLTGHSNEPFLFNNNIVSGQCLRIKSKSTGATSTVRFDKSSSAFDLLVKNKRVNTDTSINYKYDFVDGYLTKDGTVGLSGQALGCVDLSDAVYWYDGGINYTSLAKRLGNLSSNAKSLKVTVDGVTSTVNFNKDYSAMSNAQILAEINAQLTNAVADLYTYGREYYPQMPDVSELCYNNTGNFIAKGSIVTKSDGFVRLANDTDKVFGVALEDIPVMFTTSEGANQGQGLVMKKGYIDSNTSAAHFVLSDYQNAPIGTKFKVNNGRLVTDINGKISVNIANGIISINC